MTTIVNFQESGLSYTPPAGSACNIVMPGLTGPQLITLSATPLVTHYIAGYATPIARLLSYVMGTTAIIGQTKQRLVNAVSTFVATLPHPRSKIVPAVVTFVSSLVPYKVTHNFQTLTATALTLVASLTRVFPAHYYQALTATARTVVAALSTARIRGLTVAATEALSATMGRLQGHGFFQTLTAALTSSAAIRYWKNPILTATVTLNAVLAWRPPIQYIQAVVATLVMHSITYPLQQYTKVASVATSAVMTRWRYATAAVASATTLVASRAVLVAKRLAVTLAVAPTRQVFVYKYMVYALTVSATAQRAVAVARSASSAVNAALNRYTWKVLATSVTPVGRRIMAVAKAMTASASAQASLGKGLKRTLAAAKSLIAAISRVFYGRPTPPDECFYLREPLTESSVRLETEGVRVYTRHSEIVVRQED
jgi:hypothetical protein